MPANDQQPGCPLLGPASADRGWASARPTFAACRTTPLCALARHSFALFACCLCLCLFTSRALAQSPLLKLVDDHYNHLKSLRTQYTEHYAGMGMSRTESGTLTLKKPGRMLWQYDDPPGKVFVLDGKFAWFYTPGDAQAQRIPARQMDDLRTPLRFLLGHTQLQKELDNLTITPIPNTPDFRIAGVPKGMANRVKTLSLDVTPTGQITAMRVEELDGSLTEFTFTNMHEDIPVPDADFIFSPPPGVAIVNGLPPI
jgi:outer membrane lipoprotein carrier protein